MATLPTPTAALIDADVHERAARRLQAWASRHPDAAALAALASLAVRIDSALLRRLRLQLLPRAEPGTEADVWFSGLHESRGRDGVVLDAGVQRLLRARLAQQPAGDGGVRPLDAAWCITAALHADAPEAIRTEETLTWEALRGGNDLPERIDTLLAPALAAMAGGSEARALEVARWAQRAVPRLPDAARQHPSALALWLAALMRLGLPASRLPDTGEAGLPPALQWLLPQGQVSALQRVAVTPFDDALVLRPLADDAPAEVNEISLPRTKPLLLAVRVDGDDGAGAPLLQRTVALEATAGESRLLLPDGWRALELQSLGGDRWRLGREAGSADVVEPTPDWQRMRVRVLGDGDQPVGMGLFVAKTAVVTVLHVLSERVKMMLQSNINGSRAITVVVEATDVAGGLHKLQTRAVALDFGSPLVLLELEQPFDSALEAKLQTIGPRAGDEVWTIPGPDWNTHRIWKGQVQFDQTPTPRMPGRVELDGAEQRFSAAMHQKGEWLVEIYGAPVFLGTEVVGLADSAMASSDMRAGGTLWSIPSKVVQRFLAWAHSTRTSRLPVLLHHPVDDPNSPGFEVAVRAAEWVRTAAQHVGIRLRRRDQAQTSQPAIDDPNDPVFAPDLAGAVRLITPASREGATPADRMHLYALAARRWAQPTFGLLNLSLERDEDHQPLPVPLSSVPIQPLNRLSSSQLARALLELTDATSSNKSETSLDARQNLLQQIETLARPFQPSAHALLEVKQALHRTDLKSAADLIVGRWNASSRLDAVPLIELLAQLALPLGADAPLLAHLRNGKRGRRVLNAMPAQFGRLLLACAHADLRAPPCVVVREQAWQGERSVDSIEEQVISTIAATLGCALFEAQTLLRRLDLAIWVLVTTRPLPDEDVLLALELRLPSARFLFLAGQQPDLADTARAIGAEPLPMIEPGADMVWLQGYKRLMEWARPRHKPKATKSTKATRPNPSKPLRK